VRTAVVVGAGVGGLAAGGALARSGWHVTLLERSDRLRGNGAAVLIWPNGATALTALGLSLQNVTFPVVSAGIRRPDGRWLVPPEIAAAAETETVLAPPTGAPGANDATAVFPTVDLAPPPLPLPAAGPGVVVHADDLHDALMAGLGERIEIRTGVEVTRVRAGTSDRPAVGTAKHTFEADLIVAADGSGSLIRRRLAPQASLAAAGYTSWRTVIPWYRAPKLPDAVATSGQMLGTGQRFLHAALGERGSSASNTRGGIYWAATAPGAVRPESPTIQLNLLRRWFAGWASPVPELLEATEPQDLVQQAGEELRPLPSRFGFPVGVGGFVLLGDAAHVATPNLPQGACLAFEDAVTLQTVMRSAQPGRTLADALDEYTELRYPRVLRVARASRRLGLVLQAQGRFAVRARDLALGRLRNTLLDRAELAAQSWTPPH
jgi:2-polyprenyl-6-methoxyphenol hydroxylase-like FAD-dependent oxidoreductase